MIEVDEVELQIDNEKGGKSIKKGGERKKKIHNSSNQNQSFQQKIIFFFPPDCHGFNYPEEEGAYMWVHTKGALDSQLRSPSITFPVSLAWARFSQTGPGATSGRGGGQGSGLATPGTFREGASRAKPHLEGYNKSTRPRGHFRGGSQVQASAVGPNPRCGASPTFLAAHSRVCRMSRSCPTAERQPHWYADPRPPNWSKVMVTVLHHSSERLWFFKKKQPAIVWSKYWVEWGF